MKISRLFYCTVFVLGITAICFNFIQALSKSIGSYTSTDYWARFKSLERLYNSSQYIQKHPKAIITDDVVYSYNAGRFIQGINPILVNPEVPPLGKYIISASILMFKNENTFNLIAHILFFPLFYILSYIVLKNHVLAVIPPALFSLEKIYENQIITTPILDILQLDFLLLSFIMFLLAMSKKKNYTWILVVSVFFLGCFISTKFFVSGIVVAATYITTVFLMAKQKLIKLLFCFLIPPVVLIATYSKLFFLGYSIREILGIQKWVFLYNTGHLGSPPFTVWDLLLFNRWHTWWADYEIITDSQWSIVWPIISIASLLTILWLGKESILKKKPIVLIMIWVILYLMFLNVGQITSRYFIILLPFLYVLSVFGIRRLSMCFLPKMKKNLFFHSVLLLFFGFIILIPPKIYASYVLPYPGVMPGNKLYFLFSILGKAQKYYAFGDFAQFKYNLSHSDKYLIEAKILFEYNQFPLALQALKKSDDFFKKTYPNLKSAKKHMKDISEKKKILYLASEKHKEILTDILSIVPDSFSWQDEKKPPVVLLLRHEILKSIKIRKTYE